MGSPSKRRLAPTGEPGHRSCLRPKLGAQRLGAGPPSSPDCRDGLVHYFWGIPFCPSGLQPDQYTGVIVCQLQAYERCLKLAQSRLLRKAQFGPPVLPQPEPQQGEEPARRNWQADRSKAAELSRESERLDATDNQPQTSNVCAEEIPEDEGGQNSEDEAEGSRDTSSCASPHVHPDAAVLFIGTETQQSSSEEMNPVSETPRRSVSDSAQEPEDVVLIEDEADEFQPTPSKKSYVECPICSHKFPSEKIEVHAADCNDTCDGGSQLQVQTRSHTRRVAKQNGTDGSNYTTLRLKLLEPLMCRLEFGQVLYCFQRRLRAQAASWRRPETGHWVTIDSTSIVANAEEVSGRSPQRPWGRWWSVARSAPFRPGVIVALHGKTEFM